MKFREKANLLPDVMLDELDEQVAILTVPITSATDDPALDDIGDEIFYTFKTVFGTHSTALTIALATTMEALAERQLFQQAAHLGIGYVSRHMRVEYPEERPYLLLHAGELALQADAKPTAASLFLGAMHDSYEANNLNLFAAARNKLEAMGPY